MLTTTYNLAVKHGACERALEAWDEHVGGIEKFGYDTKIPLTDVLDVLGLDDCLWAFRATENNELAKTILFKLLIACADRVLIHYEAKYPDDKRPRQAIETAQAYLLNPLKVAAAAAYAAAAAAHAAYAAADAAAAAYAAVAAAAVAYAAADAASAAAVAYAAADAARAADYAADAASAAAVAYGAAGAARAARAADYAVRAADYAVRAARAAVVAYGAAGAAGAVEREWQIFKLKELLNEI
jgi:hypothetical protein